MRAPSATCASVSGVVFRIFSAGISGTRRTPADDLRTGGLIPPSRAPAVLGPERFRVPPIAGGPLLLRRAVLPFGSGGRLLSSVHQLVAVLLPERFRGGCAFGSG